VGFLDLLAFIYLNVAIIWSGTPDMKPMGIHGRGSKQLILMG